MDLIPEELRRAHKKGKVVFFCGAGVSVPAGLPSFKGLVEAVLTEMLPETARQTGPDEASAWRAFREGRYDEALSILENPSEDGYEPKQVREKVRGCLTQDSPSLDKHLILARLADLDKEHGRLVTTNFDPLFKQAAEELRKQGNHKPDPAVHVAPALPPAKPQTFRGLAYLHGKLGDSPDDLQLVLTTADFGRAYMLEGWARRFVVDLFRHYHVVFIGYSVEDIMMRYLVSALAAVREENEESEESPQQFRRPYAFAKRGAESTGDERQWRLGIKPLLYDAADKSDEHRELWSILKEWGEDHRGKFTERRYKVTRLGQHPPKNKNDIQEMAWALKDIEVAKHFADSKAHPGWIAPLQEKGLLSLPTNRIDKGDSIAVPLVSQRLTDQLVLYDVTQELSRWIVKCLNTPEALDWALHEGSVLHADLRRQVRFRLDDEKTELQPAFRKIWQVLADDGYAHALSEKHQGAFLLSIPRLAPGAVSAKQIFLNRLRPLPIFKIKDDFPAVFERLQDKPKDPNRSVDWCDIEVELVGIRGRSEDVKRFRDRAENWEKVLASMAEELTSLLLEAMDWLREFDLAASDRDLSYSRYPSISPHEQNQCDPDWTQLIALTQESYDALLSSGEQDAAARLARRWRSLPYPVFRRLALYAATGAGMHDVNFGLEVLLEGPQPVLWGIHTQRETLRFLRKRGKDIPKESLARLIEEILEGPPRSLYRQDIPEDTWKELRDRAIRLRLGKLAESGVELPARHQETYNLIPPLQWDIHPGQPLGDHPEEFVSVQYAVETIDHFGANEADPVIDFANVSVEQFIEWTETQTGMSWRCGGGWPEFLKSNTELAVNLLRGASSKGKWPISPWYAMLRLLGDKKETEVPADVLQREAADLLVAMPLETLAKLDFPASEWLGEVRTKLGEKTRRALWGAIWDASLMGEPPEGKLDFSSAINHAGGILGEILWKELTDIIPKVSAGENPGFPEPLRPDFERIAEDDRPAGKLARVNLAPYLIWLYRIAPDWSERAFFRRMDIDDGKAFDPYLWEGYLWNPRCTDDLLAAFKPLLLKVLESFDRLRESVRDTVCRNGVTLFIHMAIPPDRGIDTEEAKGVLWNIGTERLAEAARTLRDMLDGAGEKSGALWRDTIGPWFARAWPRRSKDKSPELSEQLAWMAMESGDAFPQAVAAIEGILKPEKHSASLYHLIEKKDIIERYPDAVLTLVAGLVDDNSGVWNLCEVLECIANAKPELKESGNFQRLEARI